MRRFFTTRPPTLPFPASRALRALAADITTHLASSGASRATTRGVERALAEASAGLARADTAYSAVASATAAAPDPSPLLAPLRAAAERLSLPSARLTSAQLAAHLHAAAHSCRSPEEHAALAPLYAELLRALLARGREHWSPGLGVRHWSPRLGGDGGAEGAAPTPLPQQATAEGWAYDYAWHRRAVLLRGGAGAEAEAAGLGAYGAAAAAVAPPPLPLLFSSAGSGVPSEAALPAAGAVSSASTVAAAAPTAGVPAASPGNAAAAVPAAAAAAPPPALLCPPLLQALTLLLAPRGWQPPDELAALARAALPALLRLLCAEAHAFTSHQVAVVSITLRCAMAQLRNGKAEGDPTCDNASELLLTAAGGLAARAVELSQKKLGRLAPAEERRKFQMRVDTLHSLSCVLAEGRGWGQAGEGARSGGVVREWWWGGEEEGEEANGSSHAATASAAARLSQALRQLCALRRDLFSDELDRASLPQMTAVLAAHRLCGAEPPPPLLSAALRRLREEAAVSGGGGAETLLRSAWEISHAAGRAQRQRWGEGGVVVLPQPGGASSAPPSPSLLTGGTGSGASGKAAGRGGEAVRFALCEVGAAACREGAAWTLPQRAQLLVALALCDVHHGPLLASLLQHATASAEPSDGNSLQNLCKDPSLGPYFAFAAAALGVGRGGVRSLPVLWPPPVPPPQQAPLPPAQKQSSQPLPLAELPSDWNAPARALLFALEPCLRLLAREGNGVGSGATAAYLVQCALDTAAALHRPPGAAAAVAEALMPAPSHLAARAPPLRRLIIAAAAHVPGGLDEEPVFDVVFDAAPSVGMLCAALPRARLAVAVQGGSVEPPLPAAVRGAQRRWRGRLLAVLGWRCTAGLTAEAVLASSAPRALARLLQT